MTMDATSAQPGGAHPWADGDPAGLVDQVVYSAGSQSQGTLAQAGVVAIVQARLGSERMPGKVLKPIVGRPMLAHVVDRVSRIRGIQQVVVATSSNPQDQPVVNLCRSLGVGVFQGSHRDVLNRFYQAARRFEAQTVVRVTADCPLLDPDLGSALLELYGCGRYDHLAVATGAGAVHLKQGRFPDGLDLECLSFRSLETAWREARTTQDREHVTPFIWRQPSRFRIGQLVSKIDYSRLRWTVDYPLDFEIVTAIYEALYEPHKAFSMKDVLALLRRRPELLSNQSLGGDEDYRALWDPDPKRVANEAQR